MFTVSEWMDGRALPALAESARRALSGIEAQVQTWTYKQHDRNGAHTDVTASSLASTGLVTFPRFGFRPNPFQYGTEPPRGIVESPNIGTSNVTGAWDFAGADTAGVILVTHQGARIEGLTVRNRQSGDCVALVNFQGNDANLTLRLNPSGATEGEFAGDLSVPNTDVTLSKGRWAWLMLLAVPSAPGLRWHVHHF